MSGEWLEGAVDFHVHSRPSIFPRRLDDVELARAAAKASMAGIVIKAHEGSSVERAHLADGIVDGIRVHGGIVLNRFVGGFNPHAVEIALALGARVVWMPTLHAKNHIEFYGDAGFREQPSSTGSGRVEPLAALDDDGRLTEEVLEVVEVLARYPRVVVSNGHLGAAETRALFHEAIRRGIERLVVAHPALPVTGFDVELQRELAELGAVIEHTYLPHLEPWGRFPIEKTVDHIRRVGAERCILSSDLGQSTSPPPAEGLEAFAAQLAEHGMDERAVRRMLADNPAELLD